MLKKLLLLLSFAVFTISSFAQKAIIKGAVVDTIEKKKLQYSAISLIRKTDSILLRSVRADANGEFEFKNLKAGDYNLLITYPKMADFIREIRITDSSKFNLGAIHLETKSFLLNEVMIRAQKQAIEMKGDTIVYQADSFAVKPNANVQDLLRRLPGIEVDKNGNIKAAGEAVNTVLVEGEEFFGDDPLLATKYLKAASVKEVQVYDRKSKQTELTGIEDGQKEKIINIKLKDNAKNGYLSTLDVNSDLDHYQNLGGMAGVYKGRLKVAVYGNKTNLNQPSKVTSAMSKLKGGEYDSIEVMDDGSTISYMSSGGDDDDYERTSSSGLPDYTAYGGHFSNKWTKSKVSTKLNYKNTDNRVTEIGTSATQSLLPDGTSFLGNSSNTSLSRRSKQSLNGNVEITLDSLSTLKINFAGRETSSSTDGSSFSQSKNGNGVLVSKNDQFNLGTTSGEAFDGNLNYTRKSKKKGRTLTVDLQPEYYSNKLAETNLNKTFYFDELGNPKQTDSLNLFNNNANKENSFGARISYTEPLAKKWSLQTAYSLKTVSSTSNKMVYDNAQNRRRIDSLSNNFEFGNFSNIGKLILQYRPAKFSLAGGVEATQTSFELKDLDRGSQFNRSYINWAPRVNFTYKLAQFTSLTVNYSGATNQPRVEQLQPIREITNPLYQIVGNANLKPSFNNNLSLNFNSYKFKSEQFIYGYVSYTFTRNQIVSTQNIDSVNKTVSSYTNLNGNNNIGASVSYQKGFSKINFRTNVGLSYSRSQYASILNDQLNSNLRSSYSLNVGLSYRTDKVDVNYNPSFNLSNSSSSLGSINDGKNFYHNHEIDGTIQLPEKLEFKSTVSLSYQPPNASFDKAINIYIWNAYLSKKMLKTDALEMKISVSDILNQRIGYYRNVSGNYISESTNNFIPRYFLIGATYNFSGNFVKATTK